MLDSHAAAWGGFSDLAWSLLSVALLIGANAFFVATEFALVTVRRTRVERLVVEGVVGASTLRMALRHLDRYIAGTQVGITLASIALGWVGEPALAGMFVGLAGSLWPAKAEQISHGLAAVAAFGLITFLHVVLGELVPKSVALQRAETVSLLVARPMKVFITVCRPLIWSMNGLGALILRCFGFKLEGTETVHSAEELEMLVRQSHAAGELDDTERALLQRTFRFSETTAGEVMVPQGEVAGLDLRLPLDELLDVAAKARHTRFPVFEQDMDHVTGVIYLHDLFRLSREAGPRDLHRVIRAPLYVPDSLHLNAILDRFRKAHTQIAIVVDEYGVTAGIITLEDIVEAVFGELHDQLEAATPQIVKAKDGGLLVRGDTRIVDLNDVLGWALPEVDAETVAGYVMARLGRIAREGDTVEGPRGRFKVTAMDRHRIVQVHVVPKRGGGR